MNGKELVQYGISALKKKGAQKVHGYLVESEKQELNIEANKMTLFRTTFDTNLVFTCYVDQRKGSVVINQTDRSAIDRMVGEAIELAKGSPEDPAYDIAENQPAKVFQFGPDKADLPAMYDKFSRFMDYVRKTYPTILFDPAMLDFTSSEVTFANSNGVDFVTRTGKHGFGGLFSAKDGKNSSSFNYTGFSAKELDRELQKFGSLETLLRQTTEQVSPNNLPEKFTGEIVVTPDCLGDFLSFFINTYLGDRPLITGTSIFKDKMDQEIADPKLTIRSCPTSKELAAPSFFTNDGYESRDLAYVEKGVLKSFALSMYGANKTGKKRALNDAQALFVDSGDVSYEEMVKSVKRGILLCRFSGGYPGESGDFSGVAKNSYYIENGTIKFPLKETMIAGNIAGMFKNIRGISKERINFGSSVLPWIGFPEISITGK